MERLNRCPEARAMLPAYIEGELSSLEARRLEGHTAICSACRRELTQYRAALGALRAPRTAQPHRDLHAGFAAKLSRFESRSRSRQLQLKWAGACCLLLIVGGASASYVTTMLRPTSVPSIGAPNRGLATARETPSRSATSKLAQPAVTSVEPKFDWKSDTSPDDSQTTRDPFDPANVGASSTALAPPNKYLASSGTAVNRASRDGQPIDSDRNEFLNVKPRSGATAEQIIVQSRHEDTVAQYAAPVIEETKPTAGRPDESHEFARTSPDEDHPIQAPLDGRPSASDGGSKPIAVASERDSRVDVNGAKTDVSTAIGYNRAGRPVLVKVSIGRSRLLSGPRAPRTLKAPASSDRERGRKEDQP